MPDKNWDCREQHIRRCRIALIPRSFPYASAHKPEYVHQRKDPVTSGNGHSASRFNHKAGHSLWTAASRAVRAPSRFDRSVLKPASPPFLLAGGTAVRSEVANVYEIGYRGQSASRISYSVTAFHTIYHHLRTQEIAPSGTSLFFASQMEGKSNGIEMWGNYQATDNWRLSGRFNALRERLRLKPGSTDIAGRIVQEGRDPAQRWMLRSSLNLPRQTEFDATMRHVVALSNPRVPSYLR